MNFMIVLRTFKFLAVSKKKENSKCHIMVLHFEIANIHILTGYKSPRTSFAVFKKHLEAVMTKHVVESQTAQVVLLGDFNFNTMENNSPLEQYMTNQFNLMKALKDQVTTSNNTQIDVIFVKNIQNYHAGVYETYFSDHKPIFIIDKNLQQLVVSSQQHAL